MLAGDRLECLPHHELDALNPDDCHLLNPVPEKGFAEIVGVCRKPMIHVYSFEIRYEEDVVMTSRYEPRCLLELGERLSKIHPSKITLENFFALMLNPSNCHW